MDAVDDAVLAASLFAVDPVGSGGVCIRSPVHPAREQWLQVLRDLLPADASLRRIPFNIADGRLLGGLDLAGTIQANRPVVEPGVLAATDGGVLVVSMAERLTSHTAACINFVLDAGEVVVPRPGAVTRNRARVGIVALDEGMSEDEVVPASLLDRMAFLLDFNAVSTRALLVPVHDTQQILAARSLLPEVGCDSKILSSLCATAMALGIESPRASMLAVRVARIAAALDGRIDLRVEDAVLAGRLVLAPRSRIAQAPPPSPLDDRSQEPTDRPQQSESGDSLKKSAELNQRDMDDLVLAAAQASIPNGLLARLRDDGGSRLNRSVGAGRAGAMRNASGRGRPYGVRSGAPRGEGRLNVIETLRAAAPWQSLRGRYGEHDARLRIRREDFRVTRYRERVRTLTIFAVDASGSSALHRLAEAKGAVELLLAECYIRRDHVAVIAFRGRTAEVLLPPTRSLVRAKRSLANLPGGGGTPLAAAIEIAAKVANQAQRRGETPTIVMLTDGQANVLRNGAGGREAAHAEALRAAGAVRGSKISAIFIDTSPRPNVLAKDLAQTMNARYVPLPFADARTMLDIVVSSR